MDQARNNPRRLPAMINEDWAYFRNQSAGHRRAATPTFCVSARKYRAVLRAEKVGSRLILFHRIKKTWFWAKGLAKQRLIEVGAVPRRYHTRPIRRC